MDVLVDLLGRHVDAPTPGGRAAFVAGLVGWSVALFPFLKYPANPPGVGDAATIGTRQALYVSVVALSVVGLALALAFRRLGASITTPSWAARLSGPLALVLYIAYILAVYVLMPANPDPVALPAGLVWAFRGLSLAGLALFWAVVAIAFACLVRRRAHA